MAGEWSVAALTDGRVANGRLLPWDTWLADLARRHELNAQVAELESRRQAAQVQAEHRAVGVGAGLVVLAAGGILLLWWRGRRRRAQELIDLRARIARDLHDEIGSHLGSIALMSEMAQRPGADPGAALNEIRSLSQEAATSMRGIVWLVRESGRPSLHRLAETMQQAADLLLRDLVCIFPIPPDDGRQAGLDLHRHMYLFFREAVHNIARHAQARTVEILFSWNAACIALAIRDDGCGFDPATVNPGSGLANLRHRAAALGGTMTLTSHPGQGTAISLEIPWS
jgi:signal transduction histidine kinase